LERFDVEYYFKSDKLNLNFKFESVDIWNLENIEVRKWIFSLSPENYKTEWIPFLRVADLKWWTIIKNSLVYINDKINEQEKNTQLLPWDLVFSKVWTIDEVSILPNDFPVYNMSQNIIWVKIRDNKLITSEYVRQLFQLDIWKKQLLANSMSWVQPKITLDSIRNIKIPLPPLEIQNQIVEKMDFALSEKKRKKLEAKTLLESIDDFVLIELWIEYKKVEEKKVFWLNLSELWETKRLDGFYNNPKFLELEKMLKNGKYWVEKIMNLVEYYKKWIEVWSNEYVENWEIPFVRVSDIDNFWVHLENCDKYISKEKFEELKQYKPEKREVLFSKDWTIWFTCLSSDEKDYIISWWILRLKTNNKVLPEFLQILLSRKIINKLLEQRSIWAIIKHLDLDAFESLNLPLPPLENQEKIAWEVKNRIEKAKILEKEAFEVYENAKKEVEGMILV